MARINIENRWWTDPRRETLCRKLKSSIMADGLAMQAWRLSQEAQKKGKLVLLKQLKLLEHWEFLIECELAEIQDDYVYIKGTETHHSWLKKRTEDASAAGKASAKSKVNNINNLGQRESTKLNETQPSYSSSISFSKKNNINLVHFSEKPKNERLSFDFSFLYDLYPRKQGKAKGLKLCKVQVKTKSDYDNLRLAIEKYSSYCSEKIQDVKYIKLFSTFMSEWRDWLDPKNGTGNIKKKKSFLDDLIEKEEQDKIL